MATLKEILIAELEKYSGQGLNAIALPIFDEKRNYYAITVVDYPHHENPADLIILARISDDKIVIEEDMTDKKLVDALLQQGIPREQIVLSYAGEIPTTTILETLPITSIIHG